MIIHQECTKLITPPAPECPGGRCSVAGMGGGVGSVDEALGAEAWETGLATGEEVSGRGLGDGKSGALQDRTPALVEVAGCRGGNLEEGGGSFHPDGQGLGRGGSEGGGGDGGDLRGVDGVGDCCCYCSGGDGGGE